MTQARDIIDNALATAMHGTPGALAFSQDMFLTA
jgi:hypothetical protein